MDAVLKKRSSGVFTIEALIAIAMVLLLVFGFGWFQSGARQMELQRVTRAMTGVQTIAEAVKSWASQNYADSFATVSIKTLVEEGFLPRSNEPSGSDPTKTIDGLNPWGGAWGVRGDPFDTQVFIVSVYMPSNADAVRLANELLRRGALAGTSRSIDAVGSAVEVRF